MNVQLLIIFSAMVCLCLAANVKVKRAPSEVDLTSSEPDQGASGNETTTEGQEQDEDEQEEGQSKTSGNMTKLMDEQMVKWLKTCNESFTTPLSYLSELNETGSFPESANREAKCYVYCVLAHVGIVDSKAAVQLDKAQEWLKDEKTQKDMGAIIQTCADKQDKDQDICDQSYEFVSCYLTEDIKKYGNPMKLKASTTASPSNNNNQRNW